MGQFSLYTLIICNVFFVSKLQSEKTSFGKVTLPLGKVMVMQTAKDTWQKARVNQQVFKDEKIKTLAKSRCEVKIGKTQIVRIGENAVIHLADPTDGGNSISIESGQVWLNAKYYGRADIVGANLHSLRKTFGSLLLQNKKADIFTVSRLLGHTSVKTTEKYYVDLLQDNLRDSVNGLDGII